MYSTILVPLDGSPLGEEALPLATSLAQATKAKLVLVRTAWVVPMEQMRASNLEQEAVAQAETYLTEVGARLIAQGIKVETHIPFAPADKGILREITECQADLVVMSTHGRSGIQRLVFGSVAEAVVMNSPVPVLLVRSDRKHPGPVTIPYGVEILTPLDGSVFAEAALPYAEALTQALNGTLVLMRIIDLPPQWLDPLVTIPYPTQEVYERMTTESKNYLDAKSRELQAKGLKVRTVFTAGLAADCLLGECEDENIGLVVMATHGRTGFNRAFFGSVALNVLHRGHAPLMLVRPQGLPDMPSVLTEGETSQAELTHA